MIKQNFDIQSQETSVGVVGAGPGGLATAILLASHGVPTTLYEAGDRVGGRCSTIESNGFKFDRGPTYFLMPFVLDEILKVSGRSIRDSLELHELEPMYRLDIGHDGRRHVMEATRDLDRMEAQFEANCPGDGLAFRRFYDTNNSKIQAFEPVLRHSLNSMKDMMKPGFIRGGLRLDPLHSMKEVTQRYFKHPVNEIAVSFQSKYLGMSPWDAPSLFTILNFIEYGFGVWHPKGGCGGLMQELGRIFEEMGGAIALNHPITGLRFNGRTCRGVEVGPDHEVHEHDHVVINADAAWAIKNLIPKHLQGRWNDRRVEKADYSCSTMMMYIGVKGEIDLPHHTVRIAEKYIENLEDISRGNGAEGTISEDPSFYVCNPSRIDDTMAPDGHSSLYVLVPVPNTKSGIDWSTARTKVRDQVLKTLREQMDIDLEGRIVTEIHHTPDSWADTNIHFGAAFSLSHTLKQMAIFRPKHRWPTCDGLWMVGGGTHPGSGLPVIFLGAMATARDLLGDLGIECRLKQASPVGELVGT